MTKTATIDATRRRRITTAVSAFDRI